MRGETGNAELASALGITTDQLTAGYQKANEAAISKALADGTITQAQADEMRARSANKLFGGERGMRFGSSVDYDALLADALGISKDTLTQAYDKVYQARLDAAVTAGQLTADEADTMRGERALSGSADFQSAMQTAFESAVKQAVSSGVITQAQADKILARSQSFGGFGGFGGHGFGPGGFEGRGGHGGRGGPGGMLPGAPTMPTTPATAPSGSSS